MADERYQPKKSEEMIQAEINSLRPTSEHPGVLGTKITEFDMSEEIDKIIPALIEARRNFHEVIRTTNNPFHHSTYAPLEESVGASLSALLDSGIMPIQDTIPMGGIIWTRTRLIHTSGQWIVGYFPMSIVKADPQGIASSHTYGRRNNWNGMTAIAPLNEDDDAEHAQGITQEPPKGASGGIPTGKINEAVNGKNKPEGTPEEPPQERNGNPPPVDKSEPMKKLKIDTLKTQARNLIRIKRLDHTVFTGFIKETWNIEDAEQLAEDQWIKVVQFLNEQKIGQSK